MSPEQLELAGFTAQDDPQFPYHFPLAEMVYLDEDGNEPSTDKDDIPQLLFDVTNGRFCVWTGMDVFIYTNHTNPIQAKQWAQQISHLDTSY